MNLVSIYCSRDDFSVYTKQPAYLCMLDTLADFWGTFGLPVKSKMAAREGKPPTIERAMPKGSLYIIIYKRRKAK